MIFSKAFAIEALLLSSLFVVGYAEDICQATCVGDECTFKVKVNLFAGETGYYEFEGCDGTNPTLGIEMNKVYTFDQGDKSNYYHPLGLAYWPDGALNADESKQMELEPSNTPIGSSSVCADTNDCPTPKYYLGETYLGSSTDKGNFGLDDYEPKFQHPINQWIEYGKFHVKLMFDDEDYKNRDFFYFCHIHHGMTGRFKLIDSNGMALSAPNTPDLGYAYDTPGVFDKSCGGYNLDNFQLPNDQCPSTFTCGKEEATTEVKAFASCIDAMNCHMMQGMTSNVLSKGPPANDIMALFMHQMIPHHQNAVNMGKALLHTKGISCDDPTNETTDCELEGIVRDIINVQNAQIQAMKNILKGKSYEETSDCEVIVKNGTTDAPTNAPTKAPTKATTGEATTKSPTKAPTVSHSYHTESSTALGFALISVFATSSIF